MDVGKNKIKFTSVIIQEGIDSILTYDGLPAEVAIYLVAGNPVGGFVRANEKKGAGSSSGKGLRPFSGQSSNYHDTRAPLLYAM